ncbi:hypothetical protein C8F01DRAFT_1198350, partial [Mycena amicta]
MFKPFESVSEFYPGLFLWCDPHCFGRTICSTLWNAAGDRKLSSRDLRPCLVVDLDTVNLTFTAAPLSATKPPGPQCEGWIRIDNPPLLTWKLNDAWLWVGTPPVISMIFQEAKIMHRESTSPPSHTPSWSSNLLLWPPANKDVYYSVAPVSTTNLNHYWTHRTAYIERTRCQGMDSIFAHRYRVRSSSSTPTSSPALSSASSSSFASSSSAPPQYSPQAQPPPAYADTFHQMPPIALTAPTQFPSIYHHSSSGRRASRLQTHFDFDSHSPEPVVVPEGFTEAQGVSGWPGWWRNPQTGWFWHANHGLVAPGPTAPRASVRACQ